MYEGSYARRYNKVLSFVLRQVALFAPAYPLAPILSAINNVIEIRVDAMKLCYTCQRPLWTQAADIGSWFAVLNILGMAAVLTNATMIAFVGSQFTDGAPRARPPRPSTL